MSSGTRSTLIYVAKTIPFRYVRLLTLPKGVEIALTWPDRSGGVGRGAERTPRTETGNLSSRPAPPEQCDPMGEYPECCRGKCADCRRAAMSEKPLLVGKWPKKPGEDTVALHD